MLASSRIGIRAYARGRAYDPNRYGGVTAYRDPDAVAKGIAQDTVLPEQTDGPVPAAEPESNEAVGELENLASEAVAAEPSAVPADGRVSVAGEEEAPDAQEYEAESEYEASEEDEEK